MALPVKRPSLLTKDKPWVGKLVKAYQSEDIRKFVQSEFKGSVLTGF